MFVLATPVDKRLSFEYFDYYTGVTYKFNREVYAIVERDINKAKKYSTKKRAENAALSLNEKCVNYLFEVKEAT